MADDPAVVEALEAAQAVLEPKTLREDDLAFLRTLARNLHSDRRLARRTEALLVLRPGARA